MPSSNNSDLNEVMAINAATLKLPTFTSEDPFTWFVRSEAQFRSKNITRSQTRSDLILQSLPEYVCNKISSFLRKNPENIDYDDLKQEILRKFSLQPTERVQKLMEMLSQPLGDRTPKSVWDEMNRLLQLDEVDEDGNFKEIDLKRELWLRHLPEPIRAALHDSATLSMENLLTKADNLQISTRTALQQQRKSTIAPISEHNITNSEAENASNASQDPTVSFIVANNAKTNKNFKRITRSYPMRKFETNSYRDGTSNTPLYRNGLCYYHYRWGQNARSCTDGCTWNNKYNPKNLPAAPSGASQ